MYRLETTESQMALIMRALDFYSRVGIGQFEEITRHPTFETFLEEEFRPKKELEVGDRTERGEVVEIGSDYIKTKGHWGEKGDLIRKWDKKENIKLSPDYSKLHQTQDVANSILNTVKGVLMNDISYSRGNVSWGIFNENVDDSCRVAFDILQVIRHEFWKNNPNRSDITVDASVHLREKDSDKIKCEKIL